MPPPKSSDRLCPGDVGFGAVTLRHIEISTNRKYCRYMNFAISFSLKKKNDIFSSAIVIKSYNFKVVAYTSSSKDVCCLEAMR